MSPPLPPKKKKHCLCSCSFFIIIIFINKTLHDSYAHIYRMRLVSPLQLLYAGKALFVTFLSIFSVAENGDNMQFLCLSY